MSLSALLLSPLTARLSLNRSPWPEINGSISIRASSSLEVVGTARSPSSVKRLMAFVSQARPRFRSFGISSVANKGE